MSYTQFPPSNVPSGVPQGTNSKVGNIYAKHQNNYRNKSVNRAPAQVDPFSGNKIEKAIFSLLVLVKKVFSRDAEQGAKSELKAHSWSKGSNTPTTERTNDKRILIIPRRAEGGDYQRLGDTASTVKTAKSDSGQSAKAAQESAKPDSTADTQRAKVKEAATPKYDYSGASFKGKKEYDANKGEDLYDMMSQATTVTPETEDIKLELSENEKKLQDNLIDIPKNLSSQRVGSSPVGSFLIRKSESPVPKGMKDTYVYTFRQEKGVGNVRVHVSSEDGKLITDNGSKFKSVEEFEKKLAADGKIDLSKQIKLERRENKQEISSEDQTPAESKTEEAPSRTFIKFRPPSETKSPETPISEMLRARKGDVSELKETKASEENIAKQIIKEQKELRGDRPAEPSSPKKPVEGGAFIQPKSENVLEKKMAKSERQLNDLIDSKYNTGTAKEELEGREVGDFIVHPAKIRDMPSDVHKAFFISIKEKDKVSQHLFYLTKQGQFRDKSGRNVFETFGAAKGTNDLYGSLVMLGLIRDITK